MFMSPRWHGPRVLQGALVVFPPNGVVTLNHNNLLNHRSCCIQTKIKTKTVVNSELAGLAAVHYRATFVRRYLDYLKHLLNRYDWKSRDIVRHVSISFFYLRTFGGWIPSSPPCRAPSSRENVPELAVSLMSRTFWGENSVGNLHLRKLQKATFCSHVFFLYLFTFDSPFFHFY